MPNTEEKQEMIEKTPQKSAPSQEDENPIEEEEKSEVDWKKLARKHEREAKKNAAAARELEELKASQKSELEIATEEAKKAQEELELLKQEQEKRGWADKAAQETGFNAALLMRIQAEDEEELMEIARELANASQNKTLPYVKNEGRHPVKEPDSPTANDWLRQAIRK